MVAIWERLHRYKVPLFLKYPTLKLPRNNDICLVDLFLKEGYQGMELRRLNRCRLHLRAIFLSDIATSSGRRLEEFVFHSRVGRGSTFRFPRECPCAKDWKIWDEFWTSWLHPNGTMPRVVGDWVATTHQRWKWYLNPSSDTVWEFDDGTWVGYEKIPMPRSTRRNAYYQPARTLTINDDPGAPASITAVNNTVCMLDTGPPLYSPSPAAPMTFWEFIRSQGGEWMWDYIEGEHDDMSWIATALHDESAVMVTDGSYNRVLAPTISGAGWVLVSTISRRMVYGSFYEISDDASSYRGELLGLTAIHHLVAFALEYYTVRSASGSIHCDNRGALHQASITRKRVRPRTKHADLIRNLRDIKATHKFDVKYIHVKAHQDDHLAWDELTLFQQLNVHCDLLAKQAVQEAITTVKPREPLAQLLPREQAALVVGGNKLTTDTAKALRYSLGLVNAMKFFTRPTRIINGTNKGGLGWSPTHFNIVDWHTLELVLASKPAMYGVWLAKQTIGVCATRRNITRIQGCGDDRCPNCLIGPERNTHLNRCLDEGRSLLFGEAVNELEDWMIKHDKTNRELCYWLIKYLHFRGERTMRSLGTMPPAIFQIAEDIDLIGWTDLLHGRIPVSLRIFQQDYCASMNSRMNGQDWARSFVTKLVDISHGQWMYRNFSLHSKTKGHLKLSRQADVLTEIARLSDCRPDDVPAESRFLLEVEVNTLDQKSLAHQEYWIAAMKAAVKAGQRGRARRGSPASRQPSACSQGPERSGTTTAAHRRNLHRFRRKILALEAALRDDLDLDFGAWRNKRPHSDSNDVGNGSNKRFRKPD